MALNPNIRAPDTYISVAQVRNRTDFQERDISAVTDDLIEASVDRVTADLHGHLYNRGVKTPVLREESRVAFDALASYSADGVAADIIDTVIGTSDPEPTTNRYRPIYKLSLIHI